MRSLREITQTLITATALSAGLFLFAAPASADFPLFGVTRDGDIYRVDVDTDAPTPAASTATRLENNAFNRANGLATNSNSNRLYYRSGNNANNPTGSNPQGNNAFFTYSLTTNTESAVTVTGNGGLLPGGSTNASFFNNNYFYIQENTSNLVRVTFPTATTATFDIFAIQGNVGAPLQFDGDIAINNDGFLFGTSNSRIFRIDLSTLNTVNGTVGDTAGNSNGYTETTTNVGSMQIAFGPGRTQLYGHTPTNGAWYQITTSNTGSFGTATSYAIPTFTSPEGTAVEFIDLGDSSFQPVPAPPAVVSLGIGAGVGLLGAIRTRYGRRSAQKRKNAA